MGERSAVSARAKVRAEDSYVTKPPKKATKEVVFSAPARANARAKETDAENQRFPDWPPLGPTFFGRGFWENFPASRPGKFPEKFP